MKIGEHDNAADEWGGLFAVLAPAAAASTSEPARAIRRLSDDQRALAESCYPLAMSLANKFTASRGGRNCEDAESVAGEILVKAAFSFRPELGFRFSTYCHLAITRALYSSFRIGKLLVVARQQSLSRVDEDGRDFDLPDREPERDFYSDDFADVRNAIESLAPQERQLVVERYFDDQSNATIGKRMGISREAVRQHVDRAIDKMRDAIGRGRAER